MTHRADLLFISCTALRASLVIDQIEQRIGKPVVSSNQALAWHSLQLAGLPQTGVRLWPFAGRATGQARLNQTKHFFLLTAFTELSVCPSLIRN